MEYLLLFWVLILIVNALVAVIIFKSMTKGIRIVTAMTLQGLIMAVYGVMVYAMNYFTDVFFISYIFFTIIYVFSLLIDRGIKNIYFTVAVQFLIGMIFLIVLAGTVVSPVALNTTVPINYSAFR